MTKKGFMERALEAIDKDVDEQIAEGTRLGASALEISMIDKILRPYTKMLEMQRMADKDPEEWMSTTAWLSAVLVTECVLNTTEKSQVDQVYATVNRVMIMQAENIKAVLENTLAASKPH